MCGLPGRVHAQTTPPRRGRMHAGGRVGFTCGPPGAPPARSAMACRTIPARALELTPGTVPPIPVPSRNTALSALPPTTASAVRWSGIRSTRRMPRAPARQGPDPDRVCGKPLSPRGIHWRGLVGAQLPCRPINRLSVSVLKAPPWSSCLNFRNRPGARRRLVLVPARRLPIWFRSQRGAGGARRLGGPLPQRARHLTRPPGKNTPLPRRPCSNRAQSSRYPPESAAQPSRHPRPRSGRPEALPVPIAQTVPALAKSATSHKG